MKVEMLRTYSRKPQVSRYIEGVMQLCRLCLKTAESAVPIFTDDPANMCSALALRIMICVGLDVKRDDHLPNLVCTDCCKELEHYYGFRKRCEVSYQKLKSHLLALQHRTTRQAIEGISEDKKEMLKDTSSSQDENMNINNFGTMICEADANSKLQVDSEPVISNVHSVSKANEEISQACRIIQPEELTSLITSVLVKLGILSQHEDSLAVLRPDVARIQLDTGDGGVMRMELVEEDIEEAEPQTSKSEFVVEEPTSFAVVDGSSVPSRPSARFVEPKPKSKKLGKVAVGAAACGECGSCGRVLASRSGLLRHVRTHSGERPFACALCGRRFAQKEVMLRHKLVHDDVRPHKCSTCNKSFTQRNALALHERSHLPPHERALALHSCPHCPKLFLYASGLSRHMMTHSGRVYVCGACRRQFADKSSVLRHHRARHARLPDPDAPETLEPEPDAADGAVAGTSG